MRPNNNLVHDADDRIPFVSREQIRVEAACPDCGAAIGETCVNSQGAPREANHKPRHTLAQEIVAERWAREDWPRRKAEYLLFRKRQFVELSLGALQSRRDHLNLWVLNFESETDSRAAGPFASEELANRFADLLCDNISDIVSWSVEPLFNPNSYLEQF